LHLKNHQLQFIILEIDENFVYNGFTKT